METFNPTQYCTMNGNEVTIDPAIMYPAVIERIRYCLTENVFPAELIQNRVDENGVPVVSIDRAKTLFATARALSNLSDSDWQMPVDDKDDDLLEAQSVANVSYSVWDDALQHRENFYGGRVYAYPSKRNLDLYADALRPEIERVWRRGDALEVALGWFLQALRCRIGGSNNKILTSDTSGSSVFYHYQL